MLAYDEKAEDGKIKLVKQNDHTWDSDMYALTPFMKRYTTYDILVNFTKLKIWELT